MHLEQFNSLIKFSIFVTGLFFFSKISCKTFKSKNKSIPSSSKKNYQILKKSYVNLKGFLKPNKFFILMVLIYF